MIGRNDHERPRMPVGEIHRSGNRPVEITHLRQDAFGIVIVSPQINLGLLDHQNNARSRSPASRDRISSALRIARSR